MKVRNRIVSPPHAAIPPKLATAKGTMTPHGMSASSRAPKAKEELMTMTSSDVPTASGMANPRIITRAGTMTNPASNAEEQMSALAESLMRQLKETEVHA